MSCSKIDSDAKVVPDIALKSRLPAVVTANKQPFNKQQARPDLYTTHSLNICARHSDAVSEKATVTHRSVLSCPIQNFVDSSSLRSRRIGAAYKQLVLLR